MSELRRTPLHNFNATRGGRMVDFAGWEMPVQFASIVEEHRSTRSAAGLFDVSHMGEASVSGPDATAFLDYVLTNDISTMKSGRVLYSLMCYEHGGVVDDLLVYKKADDDYLICLNASNTEKDVAWLKSKLSGFDAKLVDVSDDFALLALQGPKALEILSGLTSVDLGSLNYYWFTEGGVAGKPCIISRTGYTGEQGVELFVAPRDAAELAEAIVGVGEPLGMVLAGLGSRDSLRLEAGYSLYGHEIEEDISPVQANLMWTVKFKKAADFIGKAALLEEKAVGPKRKIIFFKAGSRRIIRSGAPVLENSEPVGKVVSGTFSPVLNEAIGSALIDATSLKAELSVDMRGKSMRLFQSRPPFIELNP
ncbi:MAG: glycine cleavage system aminomethyltransferase GcvT [Opitutales bacterium]|nr:glycine cleavage system aminomethyltransferase GcvT [Opitutales bacterium]MBT7865363.1 glycine cleavage system aminomethyltransferase GcvT [Opitutales bacterium]MDG2255371.1 glycine cleavage system aminomethyltransferase GcvT [Opitutaceae bacterium]